jgi:hypothetical protein
MGDTTMHRSRTVQREAPVPRSTSTAPVEAGRRRLFRLLAVVGAVMAALGLWAIVELGFGFDVRSPGEAFGGASGTSDVGPLQVIIASGIGSLMGWALLALLERFSSRARAVWIAVALLALLASLGGPLSGGISAANRAVLVCMHLLVAAIVIPSFYLSSSARGHGAEAARQRSLVDA